MDYEEGFEDYTINQLGAILQPIVYSNLFGFSFTNYADYYADLSDSMCSTECYQTSTLILLDILASFGCVGSDCEGDVEEDGDTDVGDLLYFLTIFGQPC